MPSDRIANDVGVNIRAEMGRQRMSMVKLAALTGKPRTTLDYQINIGTVTVDNLVLIAAALGVQPADLLPESIEAAS
jgi:transcriptional regulator with XRE-family HTH domain